MVLVQTSNWPNLLQRYAGSELDGHHSGPDCEHGRRPVRQLSDLELFLPDFRCQFNSADRHRRRIEALEAQHRSDPLFYTAVILFDSVIEILARTDTHSFGDRPRSLQLPNGTMRGRICIQRDDARRSVSLHRLLKETFGCSDVPLRREQEIHRSPLLVDSAIGMSTGPSLLYTSRRSAMTRRLFVPIGSSAFQILGRTAVPSAESWCVPVQRCVRPSYSPNRANLVSPSGMVETPRL